MPFSLTAADLLRARSGFRYSVHFSALRYPSEAGNATPDAAQSSIDNVSGGAAAEANLVDLETAPDGGSGEVHGATAATLTSVPGRGLSSASTENNMPPWERICVGLRVRSAHEHNDRRGVISIKKKTGWVQVRSADGEEWSARRSDLRMDSAPPDSAPPDSAPPDSAPPESTLPDSVVLPKADSENDQMDTTPCAQAESSVAETTTTPHSRGDGCDTPMAQ